MVNLLERVMCRKCGHDMRLHSIEPMRNITRSEFRCDCGHVCGFDMLFDQCDCRPIEEAPLEEPVEVLVADFCGSIYWLLQHPCRRTSEGWISAIGTPLTVTPVRWMPRKRPS